MLGPLTPLEALEVEAIPGQEVLLAEVLRDIAITWGGLFSDGDGFLGVWRLRDSRLLWYRRHVGWRSQEEGRGGEDAGSAEMCARRSRSISCNGACDVEALDNRGD